VRILSGLMAISMLIGAACSARAQTITTIAGIENIRRVAPGQARGGKCMPEGFASNPALLDSQTNLLKNRIDAGNYRHTTIATLLKLPWASIVDGTRHMATWRKNWTPEELARTRRYESRPVSVDGYIVAIHTEAKEATNCGLTDPDWADWHFWIVATEAEAHNPDVAQRRVRAVVGEITPRVRAAHTGAFDKKQLLTWARDGTRVRASGWTMLDPEHPDDGRSDASGRPASRGTIWELHPVMSIVPTKR
jgi:hypothetical protein